jgi:hypothetical protein
MCEQSNQRSDESVESLVASLIATYGTNPSRTTIDAVEKTASSSSKVSSSFFYSIRIKFGIQGNTVEE